MSPNKIPNNVREWTPTKQQNATSPFNQNPYKKQNIFGFNMGDSFIPGLQKQNLQGRHLIWDDTPNLDNYYGVKNKSPRNNNLGF